MQTATPARRTHRLKMPMEPTSELPPLTEKARNLFRPESKNRLIDRRPSGLFGKTRNKLFRHVTRVLCDQCPVTLT